MRRVYAKTIHTSVTLLSPRVAHPFHRRQKRRPRNGRRKEPGRQPDRWRRSASSSATRASAAVARVSAARRAAASARRPLPPQVVPPRARRGHLQHEGGRAPLLPQLAVGLLALLHPEHHEDVRGDRHSRIPRLVVDESGIGSNLVKPPTIAGRLWRMLCLKGANGVQIRKAEPCRPPSLAADARCGQRRDFSVSGQRLRGTMTARRRCGRPGVAPRPEGPWVAIVEQPDSGSGLQIVRGRAASQNQKSGCRK